MKFIAVFLLLTASGQAAADPALWSCAAYCRYQGRFGPEYKSMVADGQTLSAAFKALSDQCDAVPGVLVGGSIAAGGTVSFEMGIVAATQACAKN